MLLIQLENFLRKHGFIGRGEDLGTYYRREYAVAERAVKKLQIQLDLWARKHHGTADGNRMLQYARSLGRPLDPS